MFGQGRLGDCWFLSAVAVLTEVSRISEVIITPEYNEEGIYTVRFCIQVAIIFLIVNCLDHLLLNLCVTSKLECIPMEQLDMLFSVYRN